MRILQARCLTAEREHSHYIHLSRRANLQGGENGALNGGEVIRPQTGRNMPAIQENAVQPAEGNASEHVAFGPNVLLRMKERIRPYGYQVMECFNGIAATVLNGTTRHRPE